MLKNVMFSSFNFNLELILEDKFQVEVERREHYLFHCLQIQLRNALFFQLQPGTYGR